MKPNWLPMPRGWPCWRKPRARRLCGRNWSRRKALQACCPPLTRPMLSSLQLAACSLQLAARCMTLCAGSSWGGAMYKDLKFPILIVHRDIKAESVAGERVRAIADELRQYGFTILSASSSDEGRLVASTHHGLACILLAAEGAGDNRRLLHDVVELIRVARARAPQLPIFALGEQVTIENAPAEAMADLNQLRGILYLFEDTVPFLARQVARATRTYLDALLPPFFKALVEHTAQSNFSWHTPGHGGGVAYRKSPVGQAFHQFFGENTLRSDLSVSVPELGSLLDHTGPLAEARSEEHTSELQ